MLSIDKFQEMRVEILSVFLVQVCFLYGLTFFLGRLTVKLRYYPKEYVQEFMAATTSLLLRNASEGQLKKGILYYNFLNQVLTWSFYFYFAILMKKDKKLLVLHVNKQSMILLFTHDANCSLADCLLYLFCHKIK